MLELILDALKACNVDGYAVTEETRKGFEFYLIRHALDQNRVRETTHYNITVYRNIEDGKFFGNASSEVNPTATKEEVVELVKRLNEQAALVKNPAYTLNPAVTCKAEDQDIDVAKIAKDFLETMHSLEETESEDVNSYEIFADCVKRRMVTSTGIDVTTIYPSSMVEVVVNARKDGHEIELYRLYTSGTCNKETLQFDVNETLRYGKDKLSATKTPNFGKMDVVFSTDASLQIYNWFIDRMNAGYKFMKISNFEIDTPVSTNIVGDKVTVESVVNLKNSSHNAIFDDEGAMRKDMVIMKDSVPSNFFGNRQFSQYLGIEESFIPGNFIVSGGSYTSEEVRSGEYLEIVEFSDFQVSPFNGDIAGEIRLGYYHDGNGNVTIVSGGSVSGTMSEFVKDMVMSKESHQYDNIVIPSCTKLKGVTVTGA